MHESTKQNCSGESASSHLESIRCLNKPERDVSVAEESLVPGEPGLDACSLRCPRHWRPWFGVHCAGSMHALSPSLNFRCLRMKKVHSAKAFSKKMPWSYISVWFFTSRQAYTILTHTHAHRDTHIIKVFAITLRSLCREDMVAIFPSLGLWVKQPLSNGTIQS